MLRRLASDSATARKHTRVRTFYKPQAASASSRPPFSPSRWTFSKYCWIWSRSTWKKLRCLLTSSSVSRSRFACVHTCGRQRGRGGRRRDARAQTSATSCCSSIASNLSFGVCGATSSDSLFLALPLALPVAFFGGIARSDCRASARGLSLSAPAARNRLAARNGRGDSSCPWWVTEAAARRLLRGLLTRDAQLRRGAWRRCAQAEDWARVPGQRGGKCRTAN